MKKQENSSKQELSINKNSGNKPIEIWRESKKEHRLQKQKKRQESITRCSCIINEMPMEIKQILTSSMGSVVITPQESFIAYFKNAIPKYDEDTFRVKFVEAFNAIGNRATNNLMKSRRKGSGAANDEFGKEFEILFDGMPGSRSKRESFPTRVKIVFMSIWQALKGSKKIIFAGIL